MYSTFISNFCHQVKVKAIFLMSTFKDTDYYEIVQQIAPEIEYCQPGMLNAERYVLY